MQVQQIILKQVGPFGDATIALPPGERPDLADVYLLTGPNGSGKSTALYAVAGVIGSGQNDLGRDLGALRLHSHDSVAAIDCDGAHRASAWYAVGPEGRNQIPDPFGNGPMQMQLQSHSRLIGYYGAPGDHPINQYWQQSHGFRMDQPVDARPKFSWAAFAYAGMRDVSNVQLTAIQEPTNSPFENGLSFTATANTERLAQWIANQDFKRLKAKEAGRHERATQLGQSIRGIEGIISEIIGEDFAFVTAEEDNNVRASLSGTVIDLGLLPDGLKSIVSWIADLLMRLDRIPWADDMPPMQRRFLLLLDEVDIHLHPSWQRKVLPIVQRVFPNAQIIASTHSPFVVASAEDAQVITLKLDNGVSSVEQVGTSQAGVSYSAVLHSIFGIDSEFDIETEKIFKEFHEAKLELLSGATRDRGKVEELAHSLACRSEEVKELVAIELRQMGRQLELQQGAAQ